MPGIDKSRIVGKDAEELDEFTCGICQDVYNQPVVTSCCRQTYCSDCIAEWLSQHNTCPNDRKRLTSDGLIQSARIVLNLIDRMRIRCVFSGKGCPSVHTIAEDAEHTKNCKFTKCRQCGYSSSDADSDHDCIAYLLEVNLSLTEENQKMKTEIVELKEMNKQLMSSEKQFSNETKNLNNLGINGHHVSKSNQNIRPSDSLPNSTVQSLMTAIVNAKGSPFGVAANWNFESSWENIMPNICKAAIKKFDISKHTYDDFIDMITTKLDQCPNGRWSMRYYTWSVAVFENEVQGNLTKRPNFMKLSFGRLYIVICAILKFPNEFQLGGQYNC